MVKRWYDEVKNYDYDSGQSKIPERVTKHFSQIIWANTSEVGIGTAISKRFGFITVARYRPQGNKGGPAVFITNIPPEGGEFFRALFLSFRFSVRMRITLLPKMHWSRAFSSRPSTEVPSASYQDILLFMWIYSILGPLPSLVFNDSPSSVSTTPTGNGIPITDATKGSPQKVGSFPNPTSSSNKHGPSLDGALTEIQRKPTELNDDIENENTKKAPTPLAKILANQKDEKKKIEETGPSSNQANQNEPTFENENTKKAPTPLAKILANHNEEKKKIEETGLSSNQANQNEPTIENENTKRAPTLLAKILANQKEEKKKIEETGLSSNQANQNEPTISSNQGSKEDHNIDEENIFNDHLTKDFDYENGQGMYGNMNNMDYRNSVDNGGRDVSSQENIGGKKKKH